MNLKEVGFVDTYEVTIPKSSTRTTSKELFKEVVTSQLSIREENRN